MFNIKEAEKTFEPNKWYSIRCKSSPLTNLYFKGDKMPYKLSKSFSYFISEDNFGLDIQGQIRDAGSILSFELAKDYEIKAIKKVRPELFIADANTNWLNSGEIKGYNVSLYGNVLYPIKSHLRASKNLAQVVLS